MDNSGTRVTLIQDTEQSQTSKTNTTQKTTNISNTDPTTLE